MSHWSLLTQVITLNWTGTLKQIDYEKQQG
jgi:hypothetical protein